MKDILNYLDNGFDQYWWLLIILGVYLVWSLISWIVKIFNEPEYDTCTRCGTTLKAKYIYEETCYACFHLTDVTKLKK